MLKPKTEESLAVGCSAWLDLRRIWSKALYNTTDESIRATLPPLEYTRAQLSEVADYRGIMPFLVETLKEKGIRFDEAESGDDEVTHLNEHVVVLRGAAFDLIDRAFKSEEHCPAGEKLRKRDLGFAEFLRALRLRALHFIYACGKIINVAHKRSNPA